MSFKIIIVAYLVMSFVTFCVYALDKYKAKHGMWRIPEATLHVMELCCGWPGALAAQRIIRHKSVKTSFRIVFWLMVIVNLAVVVWATARFK